MHNARPEYQKPPNFDGVHASAGVWSCELAPFRDFDPPRPWVTPPPQEPTRPTPGGQVEPPPRNTADAGLVTSSGTRTTRTPTHARVHNAQALTSSTCRRPQQYTRNPGNGRETRRIQRKQSGRVTTPPRPRTSEYGQLLRKPSHLANGISDGYIMGTPGGNSWRPPRHDARHTNAQGRRGPQPPPYCSNLNPTEIQGKQYRANRLTRKIFFPG